MTVSANDLISKKFKSKPPSDRLNAETIRHLMHDFVRVEFSRNFSDAAKALNALPVRDEERRGFRKNISKSGLDAAIQDSRPITYAHLDALARFYKIPVSAILLFTRARDELETVEQRKRGDLRRVLSALRAALDHIERLSNDVSSSEADLHDNMGHDAFQEYAEIYRTQFDGIFV